MARSLVFEGWEGGRELGPVAKELLTALGYAPSWYLDQVEEGDMLTPFRLVQDIAEACMSDEFDSKWETISEDAQKWVDDCVSRKNESLENDTDFVPEWIPGLPVALFKQVDLEKESNHIEKVLEKFERKNKTATQRSRELFITHPEYPIQKVHEILVKEGYKLKRNNLIVVRSTTKETLRVLSELGDALGVTLGSADSLLHIELPRK